MGLVGESGDRGGHAHGVPPHGHARGGRAAASCGAGRAGASPPCAAPETPHRWGHGGTLPPLHDHQHPISALHR